MGKLKVNQENCIGCGACVAIDPTHFSFDDNGLSTVISEDNIDSEEVKNALESCPTSAITMDNSCDCGDNCQCGDDCNCENCDCENHQE